MNSIVKQLRTRAGIPVTFATMPASEFAAMNRLIALTIEQGGGCPDCSHGRMLVAKPSRPHGVSGSYTESACPTCGGTGISPATAEGLRQIGVEVQHG